MHTSESINEISAALALAQSKVGIASKDGTGNYGNYASLASVWAACRTPLAEHDLAILQSPAVVDGCVILTTRLLHKSGQWIENELTIKPIKADAQGIGSAITYARRYSLSSFVGIVDRDDDGAAASKQGAIKQGNLQVYSVSDKEFMGALDKRLATLQLIGLKDKVLALLIGKPMMAGALDGAIEKAKALEG